MPLDENEKERLVAKARQIREKIVIITEKCGGSHIGGSLSQTDILVALYYKYLKVDPKNPQWEARDRFVLSKGHGGIGHAAILGDLQFFPEDQLLDFNKTGSPFGMHLDHLKVPGVDASTGSLGHGLGIAIGMAIAARLQNLSWHTYCVIGDGECNEGSIWEAAMAASHYRVTNLTVFVDRNKMCIDGPTEEIMALEPFAEKWRAFGWNVLDIDGHDFDQVGDAIAESHREDLRPTVIICQTTKGRGVDFMENQKEWHYAGLDSEMAAKAIESVRRS